MSRFIQIQRGNVMFGKNGSVIFSSLKDSFENTSSALPSEEDPNALGADTSLTDTVQQADGMTDASTNSVIDGGRINNVAKEATKKKVNKFISLKL